MRLSLATKFSVAILGVVVLAIVSSLVTLYAAWRIQFRLDEASQEHLPSVQAEELEIAILEGNNLLAAQLLDMGNPAWEKKLRELKPRFRDWIGALREANSISDEENEVLFQLEKTLGELDALREEAISLGRKGETQRAKAILLSDIDGRLTAAARGLCDNLMQIHDKSSGRSVERARQRMRKTTWGVGISSGLTLLLGGLLLWLFFYRVLFPLRGMVADTQLYRDNREITVGQNTDKNSPQDELRMMGDHLRNLMTDVSDARSRLERSRNQLLAAEKLASVGRLAASVAHEIRNPLTAMKMWLFSIQEAVSGDADMNRKLAIVSEEIARLEAILRNFLEFSRPLTLRCQAQDVGQVISHTLDLLAPRFQGEGIRISYAPLPSLPAVMADADQLKQVLLNLLGNAADAMPEGGEIRIGCKAEVYADGRPMVAVRICDNGPGMPPAAQLRIFEPFFTTKENGTGLGLCIAAQVMARHGGGLVLESSSETGTTFAIWMPLAQQEGDGKR